LERKGGGRQGKSVTAGSITSRLREHDQRPKAERKKQRWRVEGRGKNAEKGTSSFVRKRPQGKKRPTCERLKKDLANWPKELL